MVNIIRYVFLIIIVIILIIALVTHKWQTLNIKNINIYTDIGLWETCSKLENEVVMCHNTKLNADNNWKLYSIRGIAITAIIGLIILSVLWYNNFNKGFILLINGLSVLCACAVPFLYSLYIENYFSQEFDELMLSKYNYSFYLQSCGALMLIIMNLLC